MKRAKKTSYSRKLHTLGDWNNLLKHGDWREHYVEEMNVGELLDLIRNYYDLNNNVGDRLCLHYQSIRRTQKNNYDLSYDEEDSKLEDIEVKEMIRDEMNTRELTIDDLELFVRIQKGDEIEADCSCDSSFMLSVMRDVGESVSNYFFWIPKSANGKLKLTVYLIIDNAGGHGTQKAIQEYRTMLREEFNIVLLPQVPRSPETNLLDLGDWRLLQSFVERNSFRRLQSANAIAEATEKAWSEFLAEKIEKVYVRWLLVLRLILKDKGGNRFVETHRGKLTSDPLNDNSNLNAEEIFDENEEEQEMIDVWADEDFHMHLPLDIDQSDTFGDLLLDFVADCCERVGDDEDVDVGGDPESVEATVVATVEEEDDGDEEECNMWWTGEDDVAMMRSLVVLFDSDDNE